jgi:hypothetical protein
MDIVLAIGIMYLESIIWGAVALIVLGFGALLVRDWWKS